MLWQGLSRLWGYQRHLERPRYSFPPLIQTITSRIVGVEYGKSKRLSCGGEHKGKHCGRVRALLGRRLCRETQFKHSLPVSNRRYFSARSTEALQPEPLMHSTATTLSTGLAFASPDLPDEPDSKSGSLHWACGIKSHLTSPNANGEPLRFTGSDHDRDPLKRNDFSFRPASNRLLKNHRRRDLIRVILHRKKLSPVGGGAKCARNGVHERNRAVQVRLRLEGDGLCVNAGATEEQGWQRRLTAVRHKRLLETDFSRSGHFRATLRTIGLGNEL